MRKIKLLGVLSLLFSLMIISCTDDADYIFDYEQNVRADWDFQKGANLACVKYQRIDSILGASMDNAPDGVVQKIDAMTEEELGGICNNVAFDDLSKIASYREDVMIDKLIELTSEEDARDILSMKDEFFYSGNPDRYGQLVRMASNRTPVAKKYMYMMAGALSELECLFESSNQSRAVGNCEDIIRNAFEDAMFATSFEIKFEEFLPEKTLVDILVDVGLDLVDAAYVAHKYHECKKGFVLP